MITGGSCGRSIFLQSKLPIKMSFVALSNSSHIHFNQCAVL